jgi:hypothetical protein
VRDAFDYCLCLLMAQASKIHLMEKVPGENRGGACVCDEECQYSPVNEAKHANGGDSDGSLERPHVA